MTIHRLNAAWQNFPGAPGVTTFYFAGAPTQAEVDGVRAFFLALVAILPTGLTIQVPSTGDSIDETDGSITGTWSVGTTPAVVTGTAAGTYAGMAGAVVHWLTGGVVNSRRVRGRSFLVPLIGSAFDAVGSLSATTITTLTNAANALLAATDTMAVWARPFDGTVADPNPRAGSSHFITSIRIPDLAVALRSRRT
jgi:hypothetical protein